ncbi:MAG: hypothetical protein K0S63_1127, partial [Gammaproteobacteria bacterium]|nr:hypothetical protein [Gammaproteobacteria bacterium]
RRNPPDKIASSKSYKVDLIWWITTQKARLIHPTLLRFIPQAKDVLGPLIIL